MSKGQATRSTIIDEALRQATLVGLEGVSLGPLAEGLGLSKSGLFAHFKSKEALQLAVLQTAIDRFKTDVIGPSARYPAIDERLSQFFTRWLTWIRSVEHYGGCLFITIAQEYDGRPGPIRDLLAGSQKDVRLYLASLVRQGIKQGVFRAGTDADQWVFEFYGAALSYQLSANLLDDRSAKRRATTALARLIESARA